jgi:1,4-alpha-glucan branching enzyme
MALRSSVKAQIAHGVAAHRSMFGSEPAGFWLPECAFAPGLDEWLAEQGIRWTAIDSHGLMRAYPSPRNAVWNPVFMPSGVAAFGRDRESARQVWNAADGFPGHADYREFYRDAGWDAPLESARPFLPDGVRKFTGLKLHRITGRDEKEYYDRGAAMRTAELHAEQFVSGCAARIAELRDCLDAPPVIFAPFDAELFGHWWFEGPEWLELVLRKCCATERVPLTTPAAYLAEHDTHQIVEPVASSWGDGGHWGVWLDPVNAWMYPELHAAERSVARIAGGAKKSGCLSALEERVLRQLIRELFLAQSSDWAFLIKAGTAREYSERRIRTHLANVAELTQQFERGAVDENRLSELEARAPFLNAPDWRQFAKN